MNLFLDIGNTKVKYATKISPNSHDIASIYLKDIDQVFFDENWRQTKNVYIASVAKDETIAELVSLLYANDLNVHLIQTEQENFGVSCCYQRPETMGVDRWLALLGAAYLYPRANCLIIDAGTATTIELLADNGQQIGGWIFPGIDMLVNSFNHATAKVNVETRHSALRDFGQSTSSGVHYAAWAGTIGLINEAIKCAEQHVSQLDHIIITGGNAQALNEFLEPPAELVNNLVMLGLSRYCK